MDIENKRETIITIAPGRVCLFGDHQDYLGLPIIACAISRYIKLEAKPNNGDSINIYFTNLNEKRVIRFGDDYKNVKGDFLRASLKVLKFYGCIPTSGYDVEIVGNIAINAGTSSSSALIIAWIRFLLQAFGCNEPITPELVSLIAYKAEVVEQESSGGKMDQYSIGIGDIIYLETGEDLVYKKFSKNIPGLIVGESGLPKDTLGVLKHLKENAWLSILKIKEKIKDFDIAYAKVEDLPVLLNYLPDNLQPYFKAAVLNHNITQLALLEIGNENIDLKRIGDLMNHHHLVLKDLLKITVPRIDDMIDAAINAGAYGAKIVGSGKGGCIVAIAPINKQDAVINAIKKSGGQDAYSVTVDSGARLVKKEETVIFS